MCKFGFVPVAYVFTQYLAVIIRTTYHSFGNVYIRFPHYSCNLARNKLKISVLEQGRLLDSCRIEREKLYPGPGLEPRSLAFRASALTTELSVH